MRRLVYYDTGEEYFKSGHSIYINFYEEPVETHLHAHDFIEIAYVFEGEGIHRIGECEYSVKKGDLFLINYDTPHEFRSLPEYYPDKPLKVYNCVFKPEFIEAFAADFRDFSGIADFLLFRSLFPTEVEALVNIKLPGQEIEGIEEIFKKMYAEYTQKDEGYIGILRSNVIELLILIFRKFKKTGEAQEDTLNGHTRVIKKVMKYLRDNYRGTLKLRDLSTVVFLSPNYICKLFKDTTGITVSEYIQKIRIEEACRLLTLTDKKIVEIAQEVGYKDLRHFQEVFKKITGKSPGEYRRKIGNEI